MNKINRIKNLSAILLTATILLRNTYYETLSQKMDNIFFLVLGIAIILLIIPLNYIKSIKAGGIELILEQPQMKATLSSFGDSENQKLKNQLINHEKNLSAIHRSRVLWIDDKPHDIRAERRLYRTLGIETISAISSEEAENILKTDNDFDLIITDVQRCGDTHKKTGGIKIHEGVNFIVKLRQQYTNETIKNIPVIFYAAYDWPRLVEFTFPAKKLHKKTAICNSISDLLSKTIFFLVEERTLVLPSKKIPTDPYEEHKI